MYYLLKALANMIPPIVWVGFIILYGKISPSIINVDTINDETKQIFMAIFVAGEIVLFFISFGIRCLIFKAIDERQESERKRR